ncbi:Prolycopene isomerase, chloroplastic, partial [Tetrabaena socialis]
MSPPPINHGGSRSHDTDFVVIGSGIGGLCCAALLAKYGYRVTVCESHYLAGGAAHSFEVKGFKFDAGPSFFLGIGGEPGDGSVNPLKQWVVYPPEGDSFPNIASQRSYEDTIARRGGPEALRQWRALDVAMKPLQTAAGLFPAAALRADPGVLLTAARFLGPEMMGMGFIAPTLTGPFSALVDKHVSDPWLRAYLDLEMGGSKAIVDALLRGIKKHGGRILLRSHVQEILMEGGRASGVILRPSGPAGSNSSSGRGGGGGPELIRARCGVVSNASVWDTQRMLPAGAAPADWAQASEATPALESFVHLHLGIDAAGLPPDLECHHLVVNDWQRLTAPQNVIIASIPTVFDPSLAPPGKATVHCYCAANEPYGPWAGMDRRSAAYKAFKEERAQPLWKALERVIPDIRQRAELTLVGSPLTHERFVRRHRGSYGPGISAAGDQTWPGPKTPIPGLSVCGDSCMPGIGVPAAAASGMITANSLANVFSHLRMMDALLPPARAA